ncbi:hypothetical protein Ddye_024106 [Dipteronia dyeriana]|uniref:Uncharacterized protein n=1 Tax=Dipteronia dyeriana TaxID=168575 RepID=A0AAD9TUT2_9ROSI|nr:hypothetical protein Ddye_024106 [Dipteronia dyeriana]
MNSLSHSNEYVQLGMPRPPIAQPAFRGSQDLVSSCKSSCRLFGFSLTMEGHAATDIEDCRAPVSVSVRGMRLTRRGVLWTILLTLVSKMGVIM